jgi:PIN domain nuclease of toxin-antitoxin system
VTILDAYAVLALLKGEVAAGEVEQILRRNPDCALTLLGVSEVLDHLVRLSDADEEDAVLDLAQLELDESPPLDSVLATRAGLLRARQYDRSARAVSLADCVAAESARAAARRLASSDPHLLDMCTDEGVGVIPLPDSRGRVWSA